MKKKIKVEKKYSGIAKVGYNKDTKTNICVKYRFNNIDNFLKFMNLKYKVQWINIFFRTGNQANKLAYTYGSKKGLEKAHY